MTRTRSLLWPAVATLFVVAILCALGTWQVKRLAWKEALIASVDARLAAPPVAAPGPDVWPELDLGAAAYEPVTVTGRFLNDREAHVIYALTEPKGKFGGFGFMVMTPLAPPMTGSSTSIAASSRGTSRSRHPRRRQPCRRGHRHRPVAHPGRSRVAGPGRRSRRQSVVLARSRRCSPSPAVSITRSSRPTSSTPPSTRRCPTASRRAAKPSSPSPTTISATPSPGSASPSPPPVSSRPSPSRRLRAA